MRKLYIFGLFALAALIIGLAWADHVTFTTYYPAPYGVYREMRSVRMAIGDDFHKGGEYPWDEDGFPGPSPQEIHQDADLVVQGNVGIGTTEPVGSLDIATDTVANFYGDPTYHGPVINMRPTSSDNGVSIIRMFTNVVGDAQYAINAGSGGPPPNSNFRISDERVEYTYDRLVITPDGNVGIGTTSPTYGLEINSLGPTQLTTWGWEKALSLVAPGALLWKKGPEVSNNHFFMAYPSTGGGGENGDFCAGFTSMDNGTTAPDYSFRILGSSPGEPGGQPPQGSVEFYKNVYVNGNLSKSGGSFDISHPDPSKEKDGWHLRHSFVESPSRGDNLYRWAVEVKNGEAVIELPDYFKYLNENVQVWVSPKSHFGRAYAEADTELTRITLTADTDGMYNILVVGTRKDKYAKDWFDKLGVEYQALAK